MPTFCASGSTDEWASSRRGRGHQHPPTGGGCDRSRHPSQRQNPAAGPRLRDPRRRPRPHQAPRSGCRSPMERTRFAPLSVRWGEEDSNLRRLRRLVYSQIPLAARASPLGSANGRCRDAEAATRPRTPDQQRDARGAPAAQASLGGLRAGIRVVTPRGGHAAKGRRHAPPLVAAMDRLGQDGRSGRSTNRPLSMPLTTVVPESNL